MTSSLNSKQKKVFSKHAETIILEYFNDDFSSWSQIDTQIQIKLRILMIDRLHNKICENVVEILIFIIEELIIRVIQQKFKSLKKNKRNDKKKNKKASNFTFFFRCERCLFNHHRYHSWSWNYQIIKRWYCLISISFWVSVIIH